VALGDADGGQEVRVLLVFPGLDDVIVDRARLAQTGQRITPHGRPAIDHRDVLQRLHVPCKRQIGCHQTWDLRFRKAVPPHVWLTYSRELRRLS
jgi:hypothetical protein